MIPSLVLILQRFKTNLGKKQGWASPEAWVVMVRMLTCLSLTCVIWKALHHPSPPPKEPGGVGHLRKDTPEKHDSGLGCLEEPARPG